MLDLIYCLVLEETQEVVERREQLDEQLASFSFPIAAGTDRTDRNRLAATWGKLPAHQRAMRRAVEAGGPQARQGR